MKFLLSLDLALTISVTRLSYFLRAHVLLILALGFSLVTLAEFSVTLVLQAQPPVLAWLRVRSVAVAPRLLSFLLILLSREG